MKLSDPIYIPIWLAVIGAIAPILNIFSQFLLHWKMDNVEKKVNGQTGELLKLTGEAEFAKGVKFEKEKRE